MRCQYFTSQVISAIRTALVGSLYLSQSIIRVACCAGELVALYASAGGLSKKCPHIGAGPLRSSSGLIHQKESGEMCARFDVQGEEGGAKPVSSR